MHSFSKQPDEVLSPSIDFYRRLGTSETISSVVVTEIDLSTGNAPAISILNGAAQIQTGGQTDSKVVQGITGGVDGVEYKVKIVATTSSGNELQGDLLIIVDEEIEE